MTKYYLKFYHNHDFNFDTASWGQFNVEDVKNGQVFCSPVAFCDDPNHHPAWPEVTADEGEKWEPSILRHEEDYLTEEEIELLEKNSTSELFYITKEQYDELENIEEADKAWATCCGLSSQQ